MSAKRKRYDYEMQLIAARALSQNQIKRVLRKLVREAAMDATTMLSVDRDWQKQNADRIAKELVP